MSSSELSNRSDQTRGTHFKISSRKFRSNPSAISNNSRAASSPRLALIASKIRRCLATSATRSIGAAFPAAVACKLRANPEANNEPTAVSNAFAAKLFPDAFHSNR